MVLRDRAHPAPPSPGGRRSVQQQLALVRYASHDIAGPLVLEGLWDLQQQRYLPQPGALWGTTG